MSTTQLSIYYPLKPFLDHTKNICFGVIYQSKLNLLTCANFNFTIFSTLILSKRTPKGPNIYFHFNQAYHVIIQTIKLKLIPYILIVKLIMLTKIILVCFCSRTYNSLPFSFFYMFLFIYIERIYDFALIYLIWNLPH